MMDEKTANAQKAYATLCQMLDTNDWHYEKDDEKLRIECGVQGDDLPMEISIRIDVERQVIRLLSHLPFVIPEDKRLDVAVATSVVNNQLADGSFDFNVTNGHMFFRVTNSFRESEMGKDLFEYILLVSCHTIDKYNDKFFMLGKGMLSLEDFLKAE